MHISWQNVSRVGNLEIFQLAGGSREMYRSTFAHFAGHSRLHMGAFQSRVSPAENDESRVKRGVKSIKI